MMIWFWCVVHSHCIGIAHRRIQWVSVCQLRKWKCVLKTIHSHCGSLSSNDHLFYSLHSSSFPLALSLFGALFHPLHNLFCLSFYASAFFSLFFLFSGFLRPFFLFSFSFFFFSSILLKLCIMQFSTHVLSIHTRADWQHMRIHIPLTHSKYHPFTLCTHQAYYSCWSAWHFFDMVVVVGGVRCAPSSLGVFPTMYSPRARDNFLLCFMRSLENLIFFDCLFFFHSSLNVCFFRFALLLLFLYGRWCSCCWCRTLCSPKEREREGALRQRAVL